MFAFKKIFFNYWKYKDISLNKIKTNHKLFIIYRNSIKSENLIIYTNLEKFGNKKIKFVIANNIRKNIKTDGIYYLRTIKVSDHFF